MAIFSLRERVDLLLRLTFGALVLVGCYFVLQPFLSSIVLAAVLVVVSWPVNQRMCVLLRANRTAAAGVMSALIVVVVLIPLSVLVGAVGRQIPGVIDWVRDWVANGMPLPSWILSLPVVGNALTEAIESENFVPLVTVAQRFVDPATKWMLAASMEVGNGLLQLALTAFISFFFYRDGRGLALRARIFLDRISGGLAREFNMILVNTTRSVVFGVIGTAIGQGIVAGIGFFIVDAPGIVLLSFAVCVLSVVPVGPPLVWGPVALWLFSTGHPGFAAFLLLWGLLAVSSVDNFLKPILISRGTTLPIALVFLGVFGGILNFGFLGIVLGPISLAAGIAMFQAWVANRPTGARQVLAGNSDEGLPVPGQTHKPVQVPED